MWSVTLDEQTAERLGKHDWSHIGKGSPFEPNRGPGDAYRLRMVKGRCFFLDEKNMCRIHNELGYEAKPHGCKAFPAMVTETQGASYARLSFYCPSVAGNVGKPLRDQMRWLRGIAKAHAGSGKTGADAHLNATCKLSARELSAIQQQLVDWAGTGAPSVADRLAAGGALLRELSERCSPEGKSRVNEVLQEAAKQGLATMAERGREGGVASRAGPVLSMFLAGDCAPNKLSRLQHFFGVRLFAIGLGKLSSYVLGAAASRSQVRAVRFEVPEASKDLLTRYFVHKLEGRRHLEGDQTLVMGFNLLVVAYAVIHLLSRVGAAHQGRSTVDEHDVASAVQAADLLVVEHATVLNQRPLFAQLINSILAQPRLSASLLAYVSD